MDRIWKTTAIHDLPGLAGNRGQQLKAFLAERGLKVENLADLQAIVYSKFSLIQAFFQSVNSSEPTFDVLCLKQKLSGMDTSPVLPKVFSDSITMSLTFKGKKL